MVEYLVGFKEVTPITVTIFVKIRAQID